MEPLCTSPSLAFLICYKSFRVYAFLVFCPYSNSQGFPLTSQGWDGISQQPSFGGSYQFSTMSSSAEQYPDRPGSCTWLWTSTVNHAETRQPGRGHMLGVVVEGRRGLHSPLFCSVSCGRTLGSHSLLRTTWGRSGENTFFSDHGYVQ